MNLIDGIVRAFSPESALKRARAREFLRIVDSTGFRRDAARSTTNRKVADQSLDHPDSRQNNFDRLQCIREARSLEENCAFTKSVLRKKRIYTVGRLQYRARTKSKEANKEINDYVERWMKFADLSGRHHFRALMGLGVTHMDRDGDIGFIITREEKPLNHAGMPVCPVRLQAIEADRIGSITSTSHNPGRPFKKLAKGEQEFSGVVVNSIGKPVRYRIYNRQPDSSTTMPAMEVDAENFIHLFDPIRLDEQRGKSALSAAINDIKDAAELLGLEKIALKHLCSKSGLVKNSSGEPNADVVLDSKHSDYNADAQRLTEIKPGTVDYLQLGEDFIPLDFDRPSNTFSGFIETLMRRGGLTLNLPLGFSYTWAGQGTAVRMEAAQADREIVQTQLTLEEKALDRVVLLVIAEGIKLGHIKPVPDFEKGEWRYPARITADVGRESKAMIEENMSGLISKTQIAADRGEDRELVRDFLLSEQLEIVEDAKRIVEASGGEIELKHAMWMLEQRGPNAPVEPPEPAEPAPAE